MKKVITLPTFRAGPVMIGKELTLEFPPKRLHLGYDCDTIKGPFAKMIVFEGLPMKTTIVVKK